jgi:hypothetical protein
MGDEISPLISHVVRKSGGQGCDFYDFYKVTAIMQTRFFFVGAFS